MPKANQYAVVLWGRGFEEVAAATFTTELWRAGFKVKVVGLTLRPAKGAHGCQSLRDDPPEIRSGAEHSIRP